jgi:hypothetical protein
MSPMQSIKLNGVEPWPYLRDELARIHTPECIVDL